MYDEDYSSDFEPTRKRRRSQANPNEISTSKRGLDVVGATTGKIPGKEFAREEYDRFQRATFMETSIIGINAYEQHKRYINNYVLWYGNKASYLNTGVEQKNDYDILADEHRFVWTAQDESDMTWEKQQAHKYYNKLFKEYCLADLSKYKDNKIALRWRVEREVLEGKGHFSCGNLMCSRPQQLTSWEVKFTYSERGTVKSTLVKLRLCPKCSKKLNHHTNHRKREEELEAQKLEKVDDSDDTSAHDKRRATRTHHNHHHTQDQKAKANLTEDIVQPKNNNHHKSKWDR
eukprot:m.60288 g.60288  ORF g.60288 m.60288 type:complete len:289 (+) comp22821_c0_seq3:632-1498(+)